MILIEKITLPLRFDDVAERARLNEVFKAKKYRARREALLGLLDSFVAGDLADCYERVLKMDRDTRESMNETIYAVIDGVHEQVMAAGRAVRRAQTAAGEAGVPVEQARAIQDLNQYYPRFLFEVDGAMVRATTPSLKRVKEIVGD